MEPTLGTNEQRSHDYLNYCEYAVHGVDPYIRFRLSRSIFTRVRVDACERTLGGVVDIPEI